MKIACVKILLKHVDRRDLMSIRSGQMMKKLTTGFFLNKQKPFFNQPVAMATAHTLPKSRINSSLVNLDSCKKRAPNHKWHKRNGELDIGS